MVERPITHNHSRDLADKADEGKSDFTSSGDDAPRCSHDDYTKKDMVVLYPVSIGSYVS